MTQLILDTKGYNFSLPESRKGGYLAYQEDLGEELQMVTGRIVKEIRGTVWHVSYQYGFFGDDEKDKLISICEKGIKQPIVCGFLPPTSSGALVYSSFFVISFNYPKFMWSSELLGANTSTVPVPLWGDFSFELREVEPSD